ncbi:MAG TPA: PP2C family protein-serine/threonine phosphatase, partial [Candidatus Sulfopaludibacter sp.]|nr:PP2C family protein-serine/threonine phosphatase [Candidatus Sulfopaludibacter sp.]
MSEKLLSAWQGLEYDGDSRSMEAVGGDFFDFVNCESRGLLFWVGDVSGHGTPAAILMAGMQALLRGLSSGRECEILNVVRELNRALYEVSPANFFASLYYAWVDTDSHKLHYVSAGHEPALLVSGNGRHIHRLDSTGTVLGLTPRAVYTSHSVTFEPGDMLIAFTDGITDATDERGCEFTLAGVLDVVRRHAGAGSRELVGRIMDAAGSRTRPVDDRTVVV